MPARGGQAVAQDWKPQVFNFGARPGSAGVTKKASEGQANRAVQRGEKVDVVKKQFQKSNAQHSDLGQRAKKLDDDSETLKVKTIDPQVSINIQRARQAKGWKQDELARNINEKASIVGEYESGRAVANDQVLNRMEKALGVYLRGVRAGEALEVKQPKSKAT